MSKYKDVIKWTGENKDDVFEFLIKHRFDIGLGNKYVMIEINFDRELVLKNIDMKFPLGSYLVVTDEKQLQKKTQEEILGGVL